MAASEANVAFVLVPGSFTHPGWMYQKVIAVLTTTYLIPSSAFHLAPLLSTDKNRPRGPATIYDDAAAIRSTVTSLANEGKDIVLVMSSYGGFPGTEAAFGLSKASRAKEGLSGGIISLVYIAAFIPEVGQCVKELTGGMPGEEEYMSVDYSPEFAAAVFSDLPNSEEQKKYFEMMSNHSRVSFDGQLRHEGWREVKSYYLHTKRDMVVPKELQMKLIEGAKKQGADIEVVETDFGHVPMLGQETFVSELLVKAARL